MAKGDQLIFDFSDDLVANLVIGVAGTPVESKGDAPSDRQ
jgi:hypothetical protein